MKPIPSNVRAAVARELRRRKMPQSELARKSGMTAPQLSRWLHGDNAIRTHTLERIMDALSLNLTRQRVKGQSSTEPEAGEP